LFFDGLIENWFPYKNARVNGTINKSDIGNANVTTTGRYNGGKEGG
jgi:hypothetical protein